MTERLYEPEGFTDQVREALRFDQLLTGQVGRDCQRFDGLPAETLLALAEKLPKAQLEDRQNQGPTIQAFIDLALLYPEAKFIGYVITRERDDERFTIEGVWMPPNVPLESTPIGCYLPADEDDVIGGRRRLWWD